MQGYRAQLKKLRMTGAGYTNPHPNRVNYTSTRVKWEDVQSAFNNNIRTGVIVNLVHKEPLKFLEDCSDLFRRRINNALKKEIALKVNAMFCGKFKIIKEGEEVVEFKYMNTKNVPIYRDTDIKDWFKENIQDKF